MMFFQGKGQMTTYWLLGKRGFKGHLPASPEPVTYNDVKTSPVRVTVNSRDSPNSTMPKFTSSAEPGTFDTSTGIGCNPENPLADPNGSGTSILEPPPVENTEPYSDVSLGSAINTINPYPQSRDIQMESLDISEVLDTDDHSYGPGILISSTKL